MKIGEIDVLLSAVKGEGAQVVRLPSLVAVFGGAVSSADERDAGVPPKSKRGAFLNWVWKHDQTLWKSLLVPEFYDDWNHFDNYQDLLHFEEDLAYLTSAVVIFLEAPGAIAELGAFSQISSLKERLVVVVSDQYHEKKSFISLGPLRQLDLRKENQVCVVPERDPIELIKDIGLIQRAISQKSSTGNRTGSFNPRNRAHQFALVLDLISISEVATFTDIKSALPHFQVDLKEPELHQLLFTLSKTDQVHARRYGGTHYYLPMHRQQKWIDYSGTSKSFNRSRITAKIFASRNLESDRAKVHELVYEKGGRRA